MELTELLLYASIPIVSAIVGWGTNVLAIYMTFYPIEFVGIPPFLGWQGIIPSKARKMASKTVDLMTAKLKALQWFEEARSRKQSGQRVQPVSFGKLKDSYLDLIRGTGKFEYHDGTIRRHVEPFFGKIDDLSTLDSSSIHEYLEWRQNSFPCRTSGRRASAAVPLDQLLFNLDAIFY